MAERRRWTGAAVAVAVFLVSCGGGSEPNAATTDVSVETALDSTPPSVDSSPTQVPTSPTGSSSDPSTTTAPASDAETAPTTAQPREDHAPLTSAGIVISSIADPVAGPGLSFTDWQADNLLRQAAAGSGFTGQQLRRAFLLDDDVVPIDFVVAAWLLTGSTPASDSARALMPADGPIGDPTDVVFPVAVLALFVQDVVDETSRPAGLRGPTLLAPAAAPTARVNVCSALITFYESVMSALFEALGGADSTLGRIAQTAIGLLPVPKPPAGTIRVPGKSDMGVFQALGIIIAIAGAISPWTVTLEETPDSVAYGVEPSPGNQGVLRAVVDPGPNTDWPETLKSCAQLVGLKLPPIDPVASLVHWTTEFGVHATTVDEDGVILKIDEEYVASLKYSTSVETAEQAAGEETASLLVASVVVTRPGNQTFRQIIQNIIGQYLDSSGTIGALVVGIVDEAITSLDQLTDTASPPSFTTVTFHLPPDPVPTAPTVTVAPPATLEGPCVGRDLFSQGTADMPAGVRLRLEPDRTLIFDFGPSAPYSARGRASMSSSRSVARSRARGRAMSRT